MYVWCLGHWEPQIKQLHVTEISSFLNFLNFKDIFYPYVGCSIPRISHFPHSLYFTDELLPGL